MTTLIQQKTDNDCALAATAMAIGAPSWESVWTQADLDAVAGKGAHTSDVFEKVGLRDRKHYLNVGVYSLDIGRAASLLWERAAILSVASINTAYGWHAVYWDGSKLWDPQEGRPDRQFFKFLQTVRIEQVYLLTDYVRNHYTHWKALQCPSES